MLIPSLFFSFLFLQVQKFTNLDYFQYLAIISKTKMCVEVQNLLVCRVPFLDTTHIGCKQAIWDFSFITYPHFIILHSIMVQSPFPFTLASLLFSWYSPPPLPSSSLINTAPRVKGLKHTGFIFFKYVLYLLILCVLVC